MFHHLPTEEKGRPARDPARLKPGGEFHMLDFEGPENGAHGSWPGLLHSSNRLKDQFREQAS